MKGTADFRKLKRRRSKGVDKAIKTRKTSVPDEINDTQINEEYNSNDWSSDDAADHDEENDVDIGRFDGRRRRVSHGYHLVEGKMGHSMEDYLVAKERKMHGKKLGLYAIFDGHSGKDVAEYLKDNLFDTILFEPDFWTDTVSAVKNAYRNINEHILENLVGHRGGSTAVTAILIDGMKLVVANVGDSRAVLCSNGGEAKQITVDHDPLKEKHLVESKGGFVTKTRGNVARVDGQLAMTRAFGDAKIKDHITAEPHVVIQDLHINDDYKFIILASDGLWKVMSNEEMSECIEGMEDGKEAAKKLIEEAVGRGSQDDVSCIVVVLH